MDELRKKAQELDKLIKMTPSEYLAYMNEERLNTSVRELNLQQALGMPIKIKK